MNIMHRLICIMVMSLGCVSVMSPKKITVQLFKTNQGTWGRDFSYALVTDTVEKSKKFPWKDQTIDLVTTTPSYKPLRKTAKISFDDADTAHILHVCPQNNGKGNCKKFNLASHNMHNVIAIDKLANPTSVPKDEADRLIAASAPPKLIPVAVFKLDKDGKKTTIRAIGSDEGSPDRNVIYSEISITKDTRGPLTKKLKVPLDKEFFIVVDDGRSQKLSGIELDTILNIEKDKKVTIKGFVEQQEREAEEAALAEQQRAKEEAHKAQVARAKEEKAFKAARKIKENELGGLKTKEIIAKTALKRANEGKFEEVDRILTNKPELRQELIQALSQLEGQNEIVERIKTSDQLFYGDWVKTREFFIPILVNFRDQELKRIQAQIKTLEDELEDIPIFYATHVKINE